MSLERQVGELAQVHRLQRRMGKRIGRDASGNRQGRDGRAGREEMAEDAAYGDFLHGNHSFIVTACQYRHIFSVVDRQIQPAAIDIL